MTTVDDFMARHPASDHAYLTTVRDVLASGNCTVDIPNSTIPCDQLLSTYRHRGVHLAQFSTPHAQELRRDVLRFCEQLESAPGAEANWWVFRMPNGVEYNFVVSVPTHTTS